jgi:hypothetical protein
MTNQYLYPHKYLFLNGAAPRFPSEDKENIKILPKLRSYNYYSHQIAFEMEETQVKKKLYIDANLGVFANTRNRTNDRIKNRMNNVMKRSDHTRCHGVHIRLYFIFQQMWWHLEDLYSLICQWTLHFLFRPIFRSVFYMILPTII